MSKTATDPSVLDLGGGHDPADGATNADIVDLDEVDVQMDMTKSWPFAGNSFDRIEAHQSLEHVTPDNLQTVTSEAFRVLRPGGIFEIDVPLAYTGDMANDPTHKTVSWYWRTPMYFTGSDPLAYETETGFDLVDRNIRLYLTSGRLPARPPSWALKQASLRLPALIELVKLPYVTGRLEFELRKPRQNEVPSDGNE